MEHIRKNPEIHLDTVIFQIENDDVCEPDMLEDTTHFLRVIIHVLYIRPTILTDTQ